MASDTVADSAPVPRKPSKKRKHDGEQNNAVNGEGKKLSKEERREAKRLKKLGKEDTTKALIDGNALNLDDRIQ